jgi:hypothetical protein
VTYTLEDLEWEQKRLVEEERSQDNYKPADLVNLKNQVLGVDKTGVDITIPYSSLVKGVTYFFKVDVLYDGKVVPTNPILKRIDVG